MRNKDKDLCGFNKGGKFYLMLVVTSLCSCSVGSIPFLYNYFQNYNTALLKNICFLSKTKGRSNTSFCVKACIALK